MIDAGLPLVQCLDILSRQSLNKQFATTIGKIKTDVESGDTFADALRKHPKVFTDFFTNMVEAGEAGGILDTILARLAVYMEKARALKGRVKSAMVYPAAIVSIAILVIVFLMIFVIPVFAEMFERGADPAAIVEEKGLKQISDAGALEAIADEIIAANPDQVAKLKANPKVFGWFVGQVMKATEGQANPQLVNQVLKQKLGG